MKIQKMLFMFLFSAAVLASCKKDNDKNVMPPVLTTTSITAITPTTATAGGTISNNGGSEITSSGICWSKTNVMPTISDDTAKTTIATGSFTVNLKNLSGGALYYVRAYATNSAGTGYGAVVTFTTGNAGPEARSIKVTGEKTVGAELTGTYTYFDNENNAEAGTSFQWYAANDSIGAALTPIAGATASKFTLTDNQKDKFVVLGITAKASAGTSPGAEKKSYWVGPVGGEVVTFMYNGQSVTYGVIISTETGRKWMDRNLGAKRMAIGLQDHQGYGDLFQWGRAADGHQLIIWTQDVLLGSSSAVNKVTNILATSDIPGHSLFITSSGFTLPNGSANPFDWRNPQKPSLWSSPDYMNNPCPAGWHIPTETEWNLEKIDVTNNWLKITANGSRRVDNGSLGDNSLGPGRSGNYWSSTTNFYTGAGYYPKFYNFGLDVAGKISTSNWKISEDAAASGGSCRCIKNN